MNLAQIAQMPNGTLKVNDQYQVTVSGGSSMESMFASLIGDKPLKPAGANAFVAVGYTWDRAGFNWLCPKKSKVLWSVFEFKHYHPTKGKFWTSKPGKMHYFMLRLEDIEFVPPPAERSGWGSFPHVLIGGKEVVLNTSGGSGTEGRWTDWLSPCMSTCVNLPVATFKAIAHTALAIEGPAVLTGIDCRADEKHREWLRLRRLMAERLGPKALKPGDPFELGAYCHFPDNTTRGIVGRLNSRYHECVSEDRYPVRVKYSQIDWVKTCELIGIQYPGDFPAEPQPDPVAQPA